MYEISQGYEVVSISLRPTLDKMALEIYQLENEICRLKKEVKELKERIAIKDDVICASRLVIEEYKRKLKQLRTETSISVIKDTINDMLK